MQPQEILTLVCIASRMKTDPPTEATAPMLGIQNKLASTSQRVNEWRKSLTVTEAGRDGHAGVGGGPGGLEAPPSRRRARCCCRLVRRPRATGFGATCAKDSV